MVYAVAFVGAFISSFLVSVLYYRKTAFGTLKVDRSNPEKDSYQIVIDDLDIIARKKQIVLKIDNNADLSQR